MRFDKVLGTGERAGTGPVGRPHDTGNGVRLRRLGRPRRLFGALRATLAAALLGLTAFAGTPTALQAQETTTFFDNTGGVSLTIFCIGPDRLRIAQGVRTGRNRGGYTLSEVRVYASGSGITGSTVTVLRDRPDGAEVATLQYSETVNDAPSNLHVIFVSRRKVAVYIAPSNTVLDPDTTYYFRFNASAGTVRLPIVRLDSSSRFTSGSEWNLASGFYEYNGQFWNPLTFDGGKSYVPRMAFKGSANTAGPNRAPTSGNGRIAVEQGSDHVFRRSDFRYADPDVLDPFSGLQITTLPAIGVGALTLGGVELAEPDLPITVTRSELDSGLLIYTPPSGEPQETIASFGFKVSDGTTTSESAYTMSISLVLPKAALLSVRPTSTPPRRRRDADSGSRPDTYGNGDILEITATFDSDVVVTGNPMFRFRYRNDRFIGLNYYFVRAQYDRVRSAAAGRGKVVFIYHVTDTGAVTPGNSGILIAKEGPCCAGRSPFSFDRTSAISSANGAGAARLAIASDTLYPGHKLDASLGQPSAANRAPTSAAGRIAATQGAAHPFSVTDFAYADADGDPLAALAIISLPSAGTLELSGMAVAAGESVTRAELVAGALTYHPPQETTGSVVAAFNFKVSDGRLESASSYVMSIDVAAGSDNQEATDPPTVNGTPAVSGAGSDGRWTVGETVEVTLIFSEAVEVDTEGGTPSLGLVLGATALRSAEYLRGSGTTALVFGYTLVAGDGAHGSMLVTANSLALHGGAIRSEATQVPAVLEHNGAAEVGFVGRSVGPEAAFENLPPGHDGTSRFTVGLRFSGAPAGLSAARDAASVLEVTGGTVTGAQSASKDANAPWEVTVEPDGLGEVILRVPVRDCTDASAVCIGGQPLSEAAEATVPGTPMTAAFTETPASHDGTAAFLLHLEFSHEPKKFSYRTVRDGLFDVSGGRIAKARRLEKGRNLRWEVRVEPDGEAAVTFAARATADCAAQHAACDAAGRKFAGGLSLTVPGPQTRPVVSIAASSTPVTEGAAASFALTRTGDTAAALAVTLAVTETGSVLTGTLPTSATFAAGSASAVLSVATADDEAAEAASTVTAALSADAAYTVVGASGTADVVVEDDDAAPVVGTASPIEVAENAKAVATLAASDADTDAANLSWSIPGGAAGGADAAQFALTADGVLSFRAAKDFEAPDDADGDGDYEVTVRVSDGANPVDAALVVRLADVDDSAPALTGASVDGATLTLTFSEALDGDSTPPASAVTVSVGGSARTVDAVSVAGGTAVLTLSPAVTADETVTVGYTVPTGANAKPLRDTAGNRVAAFTGAGVTNATAAPTLPVVSIAAASSPMTEGTAAVFTLTRTGSTAALTVAVAVTESGGVLDGAPPASVTFDANSASAPLSVATEDDEAAEAASTVTAALSAGTGYTVDGSLGTAEAVVEDDDAAPAVETDSPIEVAENATLVATLAASDGDTGAADLSWSIPEGEAGGTDAAQFALTADGVLSFKAAKDFEAPDDADADGDYELTVRVTDGANPVDAALVVRLQDADDAAPVLTGASVVGAALTLTFGEALDGDSTPPASSFAATVAGGARTVDAVSISESTVALTLSSAVTSGQTVTVGYTVPTGEDAAPLQDAAGNRVAAFADAQATNETAAALPEVSIAAASSPVTEGTAASFTLTRTGSTAAALTVAVSVSVSQAGSVLDGTAPTSATFAAEASTTRLAAATANDAVHEADARVTATLAGGAGYTVDGGNASAGVDVFDDDPAPEGVETVETLWSTTLTWADLGNDWYGGFADAFSDAGWSEGGQAYRIWYIAYDAGARELRMAHDGSGGRIGEPGELTLHIGGLAVGPGPALSAFAGAGAGRHGSVDSQWEVGEPVTVRLTRSAGDGEAAPAGPGFSVADAQVNESSGQPLRFRVKLDAAAESTVSVRYRTSNGTAHAGADYVAAYGAVRFGPGQRSKTVEVRVLEDTHADDGETMTLTLSRPYGATLADATATGTIGNADPMPQAWIARFGRTVAEQAIDAVEARFDAARAPGLSGTIGGQSISGSSGAADEAGEDRGAGTDARQGLEALSEWFGNEDGDEDELGSGTRALSGQEVLSGTSFGFTGGTAETGFASFWGRGAVTSFDGRDGDLSLDGEVSSAMLGADWTRDRVLAGLMLSHSRGKGGYRDGSGSGTVEAALTSLFPYGRYALSERVSVWGMAGYGEGTLTVTPEGQAPLRPDLDFLMGALGVRGVLVDGGAEGPTLAAKSDAMAVRTSTDAVSGSAGNLEAAQADVTRLRLALEGSRPFGLGGDTVLTPSVELGVRHDGGDAETGFGADIGAGLVLSDPARGLSAELRARGLLTHEAEGMRERSLSGTLSFDPAPDSERGLSLSIVQSVGAQASGGADALFERTTLAGLGAEEDDALSARRLDARIGYGLGVLDDRYTATPELGLGLSDRDRELRLGWRLTERVSTGLAFELWLEGTRREDVDGGTPEHGLGVGLGWRLEGSRGGEAFDVRLEATRLDAANDDRPPEHRIGLSVTARW